MNGCRECSNHRNRIANCEANLRFLVGQRDRLVNRVAIEKQDGRIRNGQETLHRYREDFDVHRYGECETADGREAYL